MFDNVNCKKESQKTIYNFNNGRKNGLCLFCVYVGFGNGLIFFNREYRIKAEYLNEIFKLINSGFFPIPFDTHPCVNSSVKEEEKHL